MKLRHEIATNHPVFGGWMKLSDTDVLQAGDETACASSLLTPAGEQWVSVVPAWNSDLGKTIAEVCDPSRDMDADERLFRRRQPNAEIRHGGSETHD